MEFQWVVLIVGGGVLVLWSVIVEFRRRRRYGTADIRKIRTIQGQSPDGGSVDGGDA